MLKKDITFEDLDGNTVTETYYFHYSQAELAKMKLSRGGDFEAYVMGILKSKDADKILATFEEIILGAVGKRSEDGKRFEKADGAIAAEFKETEAYSTLFMELLSNDGKSFQEFFRGVIPGGMREKLDAQDAKTDELGDKAAAALAENAPMEKTIKEALAQGATDLRPVWVKESRNPTQDELMNMSPSEFAAFAQSRSTTR